MSFSSTSFVPKIVFSFLIFATLSHSSSAQSLESPEERLHAIVASGGEKITAPTLAVVGKGVEFDQTHESIALACVEYDGSLCKTLKWVYFSPNHEIYTLGISISLGAGADLSSQEVKLAVKKRMKEYKMTARSNRLWNRVSGKNGGPAALVGGGAMGFLIVGSNPAGMIAVSSAFLIASAIYLIHGGEFGSFLLKSNTIENRSTLDKDGWNWFTNPEAISERRMKKMLKMLMSPIVVVEVTRQ